MWKRDNRHVEGEERWILRRDDATYVVQRLRKGPWDLIANHNEWKWSFAARDVVGSRREACRIVEAMAAVVSVGFADVVFQVRRA